MSKNLEKKNDFTIIDNYAIPNDEVEEYIRIREYWANELLVFFKKHFPKAERAFKDSEDGEAIIGLSETNELLRLIHLDPATLHHLEEAKLSGTVLDYMNNIIE